MLIQNIKREAFVPATVQCFFSQSNLKTCQFVSTFNVCIQVGEKNTTDHRVHRGQTLILQLESTKLLNNTNSFPVQIQMKAKSQSERGLIYGLSWYARIFKLNRVAPSGTFHNLNLQKEQNIKSNRLVACTLTIGQHLTKLKGMNFLNQSYDTSQSNPLYAQESKNFAASQGALRVIVAELSSKNSIFLDKSSLENLENQRQRHESILYQNSSSSGSKMYTEPLGTVLAEGFMKSPKIIRSRIQGKAMDFQMIPNIRGSISDLTPIPLRNQDIFRHSKELRIAVKAVGLNFRDILNVLGMYPGDPGNPGSDFSGTVLTNQSSFKIGESVFGLSAGCLGTIVEVLQTNCAHKTSEYFSCIGSSSSNCYDNS